MKRNQIFTILLATMLIALNMQIAWAQSSASATPSPTPTVTPTPTPAPYSTNEFIDCRVVRLSSVGAVTEFGINRNEFEVTPFHFINRAFYRIDCKLKTAFNGATDLTVAVRAYGFNVRKCSYCASFPNDNKCKKVCVEDVASSSSSSSSDSSDDQIIKRYHNNSDSGVTLELDQYKKMYSFSLKNTQDKRVTISVGDIKMKFAVAEVANVDEIDKRYADVESKYKFNSRLKVADEFVLEPFSGEPKCRIAVSGALDGTAATASSCSGKDCSPSDFTAVANAKINFKVLTEGVADSQTGALSVAWTVGGATAPETSTTLSIEPENDVVTLVRAEVKTRVVDEKTKQNVIVHCATKVKSVESGKMQVRIQKAGNCETFVAMKNYYLTNQDRTSSEGKAENLPGIPGVSREFKENDIPFRGVLNSALSVDGHLDVGPYGDITTPALPDSKYMGAVLVAKTFNLEKEEGEASSSGVIAFWGDLDPNNYAITNLVSTSAGDKLKDEDIIVFQAFVVGKKSDQTRDSNMKYEFSDSLDYVIPLAYGSCGGLFPFSAPGIEGKNLPKELENMGLCLMSKPYKVGDLKKARINDLVLVHYTPSNPWDEFPLSLLKKKINPETCGDIEAGETVTEGECWNINTSAMPQTEQAQSAHHECQYEAKGWTRKTSGYVSLEMQKCINYGGAYCNNVFSCSDCNKENGEALSTTSCPGDRYNQCVLEDRLVFKDGCKVTERPSECKADLAIRFSGYNQMLFAALGCAYKYDKDNVAVTATLANQGILPYNDEWGGANAASSYSSSKFGGFPNKVAQCVPCRFADDGDLDSTTAELPLLQDQPERVKPIFTFTKAKLNKKCIKDTTFKIRYFGSSACDGVSAPEGHFCSAGNISQKSCSAPGITNANNAMEFTIPLCAGSDFGYSTVAASLSPLIIDVAGYGINISRSQSRAVKFDMTGDGKKESVDWPENTGEVAFLVRLDESGLVKNINQLFGDNNSENGFEALKKLDSNNDGEISRKDSSFSKLALWFDYDRNGICEKDEIEEVESYGIHEIPLRYIKAAGKGISGKGLISTYYNYKSERFQNIKDVYFHVYSKDGQKASEAKTMHK